jgi:hypothetical protein
VTEHLIGPHNMEMIYLSPHLYGHTFNETLDLCKCDLDRHRTAGLRFIVGNGQLIVASMDKSTPGACINKWCMRLCSAWLISINNIKILIIADAQAMFHTLSTTNAATCTLTFPHPAISPNISQHGLPIISGYNFLLVVMAR